MWEGHSNSEGQLNLQKCSCYCSHKQLFCLWCWLEVQDSWAGGVLLSGGARCSPPRGWRPAGTLWAGPPRPAPRGLFPLGAKAGWSEPSPGATALPCLVPPHSWSSRDRLCSLPGVWGQQKASPLQGAAPRAWHSSSPCPACLGRDICSPAAMATCGKLAEPRAGLGNLKQH